MHESRNCDRKRRRFHRFIEVHLETGFKGMRPSMFTHLRSQRRRRNRHRALATDSLNERASVFPWHGDIAYEDIRPSTCQDIERFGR